MLSRLESVAEKLHVKLMQIIVNSCCPKIPVSASTSSNSSSREASATTVWHQGRVVLNFSAKRLSCVIRHPEVAAREILTRLVQLMKGVFTGRQNCKICRQSAVRYLMDRM